MKIFFLKRGNEKLGSNRIYIDNLSKWVSKEKTIVSKSSTIKPNFDVYILSKYSSLKDVSLIRKINPDKFDYDMLNFSLNSILKVQKLF